MKVSNCQKCKHYSRRVWSSRHQPTNYHEIGMSHAYGYCKKYKTRCLQVKTCEEEMAFFYEFDEIIPSIMSDKIDELIKE